jgi:SAM-dependent methyltransferase
VTGWDDSYTVAAYERFDRSHDRYRLANAELAARAALESGLDVVDVGAGLGGTARAALERLGAEGRVVCVEPAHAMRDRGRRLLSDPRVSWTAALPEGRFDRVLCGAAIWLLGWSISELAALVAPGGALAFTVPSLYVGEADDTGLLELPALVADGRVPRAATVEAPPTAAAVDEALAAAGLVPHRWSFRVRLTQAALRDWLKLPVLTDSLLGDLEHAERERRIDAAYERVDPAAWRWEGWSGWTAFRPFER